MCHTDNEKWEKRNDGRKRTNQIRKACEFFGEKRKLQVPRNARNRDEQKCNKKVAQKNKKTLRNQALHQNNKHLGSPPGKILSKILKMVKIRTQTNERRDEGSDVDAPGFTPER